MKVKIEPDLYTFNKYKNVKHLFRIKLIMNRKRTHFNLGYSLHLDEWDTVNKELIEFLAKIENYKG